MFSGVSDSELLAFANKKCPEVEITVYDRGLSCHGYYYLNWSQGDDGCFYANHPKFDMSQPEPKRMPGAIQSRLGVKNVKLITGSGRYSGQPVCVIEKGDLRSAFLNFRNSSVKDEITLRHENSLFHTQSRPTSEQTPRQTQSWATKFKRLICCGDEQSEDASLRSGYRKL